jgi:hypothetical protein
MARTFFLAVIGIFFVTVARAEAPPTTQPADQPAIDPIADQIFRQSCEFLAQTKAISVHAEIWKDQVLPSGHKIQVTRTVQLDFRRPDRLHVEQRAHRKGRSIWYDGKMLTVLDRETNLYGQVEAPNSVDQVLDVLSDEYSITVPLEDLVVSDPYGGAMKNVIAGGYFGDESILGVPCRHIGFSTERIDWQVWISEGIEPLPQKLVITYKTEDQSPQYTAIFSKWSLADRAADLSFQFVPPHGSQRMNLSELKEQAKRQAKP